MTQQENQHNSTGWSMPDEGEILASLTRSGYLLESEIAKHFVDRGYFVQTNQVLKDPFTGKSRELDILAEYGEIDPICGKEKAYSRIYLTCEVKNNLYPIVLLTPYAFSPSGDERGGLKQVQMGDSFMSGREVDYFLEQWIHTLSQSPQFTQYCSFERKKSGSKNELMAVHPEELYSGLSKITQACEEALDNWQTSELGNVTEVDNTHRNHLFLPVLIVRDHLYELNLSEDGGHALQQVQSSLLHFSYYHLSEPRTALIYVVTQAGLNDFINQMQDLERKALEYLIQGLRLGLDELPF